MANAGDKRLRVNLETGQRPLAGYDPRYRAFTNLNWNAAAAKTPRCEPSSRAVVGYPPILT